jgi:hypothetical protein
MTDSYLYNYDSLVRNYNNITTIDFFIFLYEKIKIKYSDFKLVFISYFLDDTKWNKNLKGRMGRFNRMLKKIKDNKILIEISQDQQWLIKKNDDDIYKLDNELNYNYEDYHNNIIELCGLENLKYHCNLYNIKDIIIRYNDTIPIKYIKKILNNNTNYYHVPLCIDSNYYKDYKYKKIYDIIYFGSILSDYPLRKRFKNIINKLINLGIKVKYIENLYDDDLSKEINKSYMGLVSKSSFDYLLCKYFEISMSKCTLLGNMASDGLNIWNDNYVHIDLYMTDKEIINIIIDSLKNKKKLLEKANIMYNIMNDKYNINSNIIRYNKIFNKILHN